MATLEELSQRVEDAGYEGTILLEDYDYADAFVGVTDDGRDVYEYGKMVEGLMAKENWTYGQAAEWIDYNTLRALPYAGRHAPLIIYAV